MIRKATLLDIKEIMECVEDARFYLKQSGSKQWNGDDGYPSKDDLLKDIINEVCYVSILDDRVVGVCAYEGIEPEYDNIYGNWITETNDYITIHRICTKEEYRGRGVAKNLMLYAEKYAKAINKKSIRIDTHPKNLAVQHIALKLGYTLCGYVMYQRIKDEPKRLIYEKIV